MSEPNPGTVPEDGPAVPEAPTDALDEGVGLVRAATAQGVGIRLIGGLAVRALCPDFPGRSGPGQDIDLATLSKGRARVTAFLESAGCEPDRRFNNLYGHQQMYFMSPGARPIDVMVDRLEMCHTLDFREHFDTLPLTLDVLDILLSKLQVIELNEKDAHDILHLLGAHPLADGDAVPGEAAPVDIGRFTSLLGSDWGWWRTVTGNLAKLPELADRLPDVLPPSPPLDPLAAVARLATAAESAPKSAKWRLRSSVGDRVRWYRLPEEVDH